MSEHEELGEMEAFPGQEGHPAAAPGGDVGPAAPGGTGAAEDSGEPIGPFPTWKALYVTVLVWAAVLITLLYIFTVTLNGGVS